MSNYLSRVGPVAGGKYEVDIWESLQRFLIIGTEGGTLYEGEIELTLQNVNRVMMCIESDPYKVLKEVVRVSYNALAPKNDTAIFVMALLISKVDDSEFKRLVVEKLPLVIRTSTHLFQFVNYIEGNGLRGWGRSLRRAIANWYNNMDLESLCYQLVKYKNRHGFSHSDTIRLSHASTSDFLRNMVYKYVASYGTSGINPSEFNGTAGNIIYADHCVNQTDEKEEVLSSIVEHGLPMECIPNKWFYDPDIWKALLLKMPYIAMVRNLANMTRAGVFSDKECLKMLVSKIQDKELIKKSRIHPINILNAMVTYNSGRGVNGKNCWDPVEDISKALDYAFQTSFGNVVPTGKRILFALDVSGSMDWEQGSYNKTALTPRDISAAMSMITCKTEDNVIVTAFSHELMEVEDDSWNGSIDKYIRYLKSFRFGSTDCSLPIIYAIQNSVPLDAIIVYTDSQHNTGNDTFTQSYNRYVNKMGIKPKVIVVAATGNFYSLLPEGPNFYNIQGFSADTPHTISWILKS